MYRVCKSVYVIYHPYTALSKIGRTKNINERLNALQNSNGVRLKLVLLHNTPEYELEEVALHAVFKAKRRLGEWFDLTKDDYDKVINVMLNMHPTQRKIKQFPLPLSYLLDNREVEEKSLNVEPKIIRDRQDEQTESYLSIHEVAQMFGLSTKMVKRFIKQGSLVAKDDQITKESLEHFIESGGSK